MNPEQIAVGEADPRAGPPNGEWPGVFRMSPHWPLLAIGVWLGLAWALFLAIDIPNVGGLGDALGAPTWWPLFNDRPVEWTQWLVLPLAILCAGYVAGRLGGTPRRGGAMFFLLMGAGLGLMLFEEAGDVRHMIGAYVRELIGQQIYGSPYQVVFELPYFAVIALLPVYAVLRYGRSVWRAPSARGYLVAAVGLYGLAAMGSGLRHLGDLYVRLGSSIDRWILGGRLPLHPDFGQDTAHFFLVDGPIEESIELLAATCMLAMILAYARDFREGYLTMAPLRTEECDEMGSAYRNLSRNCARGRPVG